jgi:hypothetical protein
MKKRLLFILLALLPAASGLAVLRAEGEDDSSSLEGWKKAVNGVLDDLKRTVRRRDQMAFQRQLVGLIKKGAEPRERFRGELRALLRVATPGLVLNGLVQKILEDRSPQGVKILFEALSRRDYQDLSGRDLGEGETEVRRRVIEYYLLRLGDDRFRKDPPGPPLPMSAEFEEALVKELAGDDARRVRSAAYLLEGGERRSAAAALAQAVEKWQQNPQTHATLINALGRTDPKAGGPAIESAAANRSELVKLAAIPWLGLLQGEKPDALIQKAMEAPRWAERRAAVEACQSRRDRFAMDLLVARYPKEGPRLQREIAQALLDITSGVLPPDPKEWPKWWKLGRESFQAKPRKKGQEDEKGRTVASGKLQYFGLDVVSSQLAMVLDISGSMATSNLNLGKSGVAVAGTLKEGSPISIAKDQMKGLLKKLTSRGQFNIVAYNDQVKPFHKTIVPASQANLQNAFKFVEGLQADGGTNVYGGVMAALADENVDTIYLLSDGEPTDGIRVEPDDILEAVAAVNRFRKTRINTIQLGEDQELMRELALGSGGKYILLAVGAAAK